MHETYFAGHQQLIFTFYRGRHSVPVLSWWLTDCVNCEIEKNYTLYTELFSLTFFPKIFCSVDYRVKLGLVF